METIDLVGLQSPEALFNALRRAAQIYRQDAAELQSAWQDDQAGKIWEHAAKGLESLADKLQREWERL